MFHFYHNGVLQFITAVGLSDQSVMPFPFIPTAQDRFLCKTKAAVDKSVQKQRKKTAGIRYNFGFWLEFDQSGLHASSNRSAVHHLKRRERYGPSGIASNPFTYPTQSHKARPEEGGLCIERCRPAIVPEVARRSPRSAASIGTFPGRDSAVRQTC
jgi:hypothetical protein